MFRLAHVSDLHVPSRWPIAPWRYLGKRVLGALNYKIRRAGEHPEATIRALVRDLAADATLDHVVVTGDLTNVSFPEELAAAREWLRPLVERPGFLTVIPGNHDRYNLFAGRRFERVFADCQTSDLPLWSHPYPFVRLRRGASGAGEVALIGLDSAVPTPPFFATGTLGAEQRGRLAAALDEPRVRGASYRFVLIHHPPLVQGGKRDRVLHRLTDDRELLALARGRGVDALLHGHVHDPFEVEAPRDEGMGPLRGFGAGSATRFHPHPGKMGAYNVYAIEAGRLVRAERRTFDPATGSYSNAFAFFSM